MSSAVLRRPRASAPPPARDAELDNNGLESAEEAVTLVEEEDDPIEDDDDSSSPVAHRTRSRSRSVSPHTTRTTTTTTTKQQTITFPSKQPSQQSAPSLSTSSAMPPPQLIQPTYQPPARSSSQSSAVFPLVTKRRLRFWIPLLLSLLLTALLLYWRSPRALHSSPARWSQSHYKHGQRDEIGVHSRPRREAVHNPSQRTEFDQYASHQDDKEEMTKERARRIIDEVHGRAAQIKQQQLDGTDERTQPHYEPLKNAHPSAKDITRERKERGELDDSNWAMRAADWLGIGPYLRQQKRDDGVHHVRGDDDDGIDKYDYMRSAAAGRGKAASVEGKQGGAGEAGAGEDGEKEEVHAHVNSMLTHLKELEERFTRHVEGIRHRIAQKTVPPYKQTHAEDKQKDQQSTAITTTPHTATSSSDDKQEDDERTVPVQFISTSPDHPLLDPLHSILASVESLIARPVPPPSTHTAAADDAEPSYWSRLLDRAFPSSVSSEARKVYNIARYEASKEAARVRRAMSDEYGKLRAQLRAIGSEVASGTTQPLELYEQYNPEHVDTTVADAMYAETVKAKAKAHTKEH